MFRLGFRPLPILRLATQSTKDSFELDPSRRQLGLVGAWVVRPPARPTDRLPSHPFFFHFSPLFVALLGEPLFVSELEPYSSRSFAS